MDASVRPCSRCGWSVLLLVQYSLNLSRGVAWIVKLTDCSRMVVASMAGLLEVFDATVVARVEDGLRSLVEDAARERVGLLRRVRREEPDPVAHERAADDRVDRPHLVDQGRCEAGVLGQQVGVVLDVVRVQPLEGERGEYVAAPVVAPLARDHVDPHAARLDIGRAGGVVERQFLEVGVGENGVVGALRQRVADVHAVDLELLVFLVAAVDSQPLQRLAADAALVLRQARQVAVVAAHAGHQQRVRLERLAGGDAVDDLAVHDLPLLDVLDVDYRCCPGDGDRLLDVAYPELDVDVGGEAAVQHDPLAQHRAEPGQGIRNVVGTDLEGDDEVLPVAVRDRRPHLLDQRRAARLYRHTGQHPARGVCNRAANLLRTGDARYQQQHGQD